MMGMKPIGGFFSGGLFGSISSSSSPCAESPQEHDVENEEQQSLRESQLSGWNFGGFMKTIAEKSGGVLQTYQHDLKEFGIGLKKETEVITEVTAHVVKDLPLSLETGASVAQESLETVGKKLEVFGSTVWRGTTEILAQVKEAVLVIDEDSEGNSSLESHLSARDSSASLPNAKLSRFESQVYAMQRDSSTYYDEPEDEKDFASWVANFNLEERKGEIDEILSTSAFMKELQHQIVPRLVKYDTLWTRYFYRLNKLQQIENARINLVKRATDGEEDEDLSWDVDEEKETEELVVPAETIVQDVTPTEAMTSIRSIEAPLVSFVEVNAETHDKEEAESEGRAGSEWLVVPQDKDSGSSEPKSSPSSPVSERKEAVPSTPNKSEEHEVDEAELDQLADLTMDDVVTLHEGEAEKVTISKGLDVAAAEENEEDWGEWE